MIGFPDPPPPRSRLERLIDELVRRRLSTVRQRIVFFLILFIVWTSVLVGYFQHAANNQAASTRRVALRADVLARQIDEARKVNSVCPDLQTVKRLLRVSAQKNFAELKKPGTVEAYIRVYGAKRGRRLYHEALTEIPAQIRDLAPIKCANPNTPPTP